MPFVVIGTCSHPAKVELTLPFLVPFSLFEHHRHFHILSLAWAHVKRQCTCLTSLDVCWSSKIIEVIHVDYINNRTDYYCSILKMPIKYNVEKHIFKQPNQRKFTYICKRYSSLYCWTLNQQSTLKTWIGTVHMYVTFWGKITYSSNASL